MLKSGLLGASPSPHKFNGHRLQIHIGHEGQIVGVTRHGSIHTSPLSPELRTAFKAYSAESGWLASDGEWVKPQNEVHLFDALQINSKKLNMLSCEVRYQFLKGLYRISPTSILPGS